MNSARSLLYTHAGVSDQLKHGGLRLTCSYEKRAFFARSRSVLNSIGVQMVPTNYLPKGEIRSLRALGRWPTLVLRFLIVLIHLIPATFFVCSESPAFHSCRQFAGCHLQRGASDSREWRAVWVRLPACSASSASAASAASSASRLASPGPATTQTWFGRLLGHLPVALETYRAQRAQPRGD